jgi:tyrosyl-tRNA synthetase
MYQYLLNVADADVGSLLLRLSTVPVEECEQVARDHADQPGRRDGQRRLARELTALVHGPEVLEPIERASEILFGHPIEAAEPAAFELLATEVPSTRLAAGELEGMDPLELFTRAGLAKSKGEVRRNPAGYHLNQVPLTLREDGFATPIGHADLRHGRFILLRRGKTAHHLVVAD